MGSEFGYIFLIRFICLFSSYICKSVDFVMLEEVHEVEYVNYQRHYFGSACCCMLLLLLLLMLLWSLLLLLLLLSQAARAWMFFTTRSYQIKSHNQQFLCLHILYCMKDMVTLWAHLNNIWVQFEHSIPRENKPPLS